MDVGQLANPSLPAILPIADNLRLGPYRFGAPQTSGAMTVVPLFGHARNGKFVTPLSGLKLSQVKGYGNMELYNSDKSGVAIVPLHMGYIQDRAQNHAMCRSAFIAGGQKRMFKDACCVQAAQGGYLEGREQWFFILPVQLRDAALQLRGKEGYSKLWPEIGRLNSQFGLPGRGHLEQIISRSRAVLTQYQSRFELLPGQMGALFLIGDRLAGVEVAPSAAYFREAWVPLVCFSYGVAALYEETRAARRGKEQERGGDPTRAQNGEAGGRTQAFRANSLAELRDQLAQSRRDRQERVWTWLRATPQQDFAMREEERLLSMRLHTVEGQHFAGQVVEDAGELVYASLFARPHYLHAAP